MDAPIDTRRGHHRADWIAAAATGPVRRVGRLYSRFVLLAKLTAAAAAVAVAVVIASWPTLREEPPVPRIDQSSVTLQKATNTGVDRNGRPYSIVADRAWRPGREGQLVDMLEPVAEMTTANGTWITMRADRGRFNEATGKLILLGNVRVNQDRGFEFNSDEVHYLVNEGEGWGDRPVVAQGPFGVIAADGFRLFEGGKTVVFTGPARARIASGGNVGMGVR
ncbi:MAG: LPS export ABC transporter periplasmic protein LptC [Rhodospirillales bacterium]|jgi:lipopolysaccharide export system protein LptC